MEGDTEHAEFYFNAFVSAGREVTWMLQKEAKAQYDSWFRAWLERLSRADKLMMNRFNKERTAIVHKAGSDLSSRSVLTPYDEVFPPVLDPGYMLSQRRGRGSDARVGTLQLVCRFSYDGAEAIALDAAREYTDILNRLVADYLQYHQGAA